MKQIFLSTTLKFITSYVRDLEFSNPWNKTDIWFFSCRNVKWIDNLCKIWYPFPLTHPTKVTNFVGHKILVFHMGICWDMVSIFNKLAFSCRAKYNSFTRVNLAHGFKWHLTFIEKSRVTWNHVQSSLLRNKYLS